MKHFLISILALILLSTCAQKPPEESRTPALEVTENATAEGPGQHQDTEVVITSDAELRYAIDELIIRGDFTEDKKAELYNLRVELGQRLERNTVLNVKLRALLMKELVSEYGSQQGANIIGEMIQKNISERISLIEESIEKVNGILGYKTQDPNMKKNNQAVFF